MRTYPAGAALLVLVLAGCEAAPPRPPYVLHSGVMPRDVRRPAPRREEAVQTVPVPVQWSFSTAAGECIATASGSPRTPVFTARVDRAVHLSAAPGGGASRIAFSGPGGSWALRASRTAHDAAATMALDGAAVEHLLALLAGGRLKLEGGSRPATLIMPDAGVSGRDWIGCVSGKAHDARSTAAR